MEQIKRFSRGTFLALLGYMPLHILLSTWIGTSFDNLPSAKIAKDIVMVVGFLLALVAVGIDGIKKLLNDRLVWLILAYGGLHLLLVLIRPTEQDAEVLGLVYNTRFLMFFLYALCLAKLYDAKELLNSSLKIVLGVATAVMFFGVVQYTILPDNALSHLGYNRANGVLPAFFIDNKPDLERVMSTLRDPNSFGSYLIIIGTIALSFLLRSKNEAKKSVAKGLLALSLLCLWFSFSRSAWLGFGLASLLAVTMSGLGSKARTFLKKYSLLIALGSLLFTGALYASRQTYFVQNILFHADESTVLEDPNQLRTRFWEESVTSIVEQPLGHGPGTAGLASIRNQTEGTVLNENYYLQIAYEVGLLGLVIFLAILLTVFKRLFTLHSPLSTALLASFAGLFLTNFLVHIWSNEAVAYTWWGVAGLVQAMSYNMVTANNKQGN